VNRRTLLAVVGLGAVGFTGLLALLPNPLRRWVLAEVDRLTDEVVAAAVNAWSDPGEEYVRAQA
jgi:hypothetical protein